MAGLELRVSSDFLRLTLVLRPRNLGLERVMRCEAMALRSGVRSRRESRLCRGCVYPRGILEILHMYSTGKRYEDRYMSIAPLSSAPAQRRKSREPRPTSCAANPLVSNNPHAPNYWMPASPQYAVKRCCMLVTRNN